MEDNGVLVVLRKLGHILQTRARRLFSLSTKSYNILARTKRFIMGFIIVD